MDKIDVWKTKLEAVKTVLAKIEQDSTDGFDVGDTDALVRLANGLHDTSMEIANEALNTDETVYAVKKLVKDAAEDILDMLHDRYYDRCFDEYCFNIAEEHGFDLALVTKCVTEAINA